MVAIWAFMRSSSSAPRSPQLENHQEGGACHPTWPSRCPMLDHDTPSSDQSHHCTPHTRKYMSGAQSGRRFSAR
eukprot:9466095-Pyramimonas_sp.AAC.1